MKKLITILFLIPIIAIGQIKSDAYYHAGAGAIISTGVYAIGQNTQRKMNPIAPTLVAAFAGYSKEMFDSFTTGNFSGKDLLITTASAAITNITLGLIWKKKHNKRKEFINFDDIPLVKK